METTPLSTINPIDVSQIVDSIDLSGATEAVEAAVETTPSVAGISDFASIMSKVLKRDMAESVNEEELFAGVIEKQLRDISDEAADLYATKLAEFKSSMARSDGYVPVEDAANKALSAVSEAGVITAEQASEVKSSSFRAAQLDDNLNALYDGRGSENDQTIATSSMEAALLKVEKALEGIKSGEVSTDDFFNADSDVVDPSIDVSGELTTKDLDGDGGFLWKPESESDGNLVVLLPTEFRGMIERVEIHSELPVTPETLLEEGEFAGDEHNGERPHYRFDKPGGEYGDNVNLVAYLASGERLAWNIPAGSERAD